MAVWHQCSSRFVGIGSREHDLGGAARTIRRTSWTSGVRNERIGIREHRIRGRSASVSVLPLRVRGLTTSPLYCDYGYKKYHTQYTRKRAKSKCKVTYMLHCIYIILVCMRCTSRDLVSDLLIATRAHRLGQSLSVVSCMHARAFRDKCQWTCWISVSPHLPCSRYVFPVCIICCR